MRSALLGSALVAGLGFGFVVACSSSNDGGGNGNAADAAVDPRPPTPADWDRDVSRPDDATSTQSRASCTYHRGQMPAETLGPATRLDKDIPITNVVVLMQENRSFDSYFGHLPNVEAPPAGASNPDKAGGATGAHPWTHAPHKCNADTDHSWHGAHLEYDDGKNDGFYEANQGNVDYGEDAGTTDPALLDGERAMWWYDDSDIPFHYAMAKTFAIGDHYFSSILGPTWPNRMYLYGANSFGMTSNVFPDLSAFAFPDGPDAVIFDELERRHVDWGVYSDGSPGPGVILGVGLVTRYDNRHPRQAIADFLAQAAAGTLPAVSFVDAKLGAADGPANDDEHPPAQIQIGQHFVWQVVNAVTTGPQWAHSVLFVTYDENGGIYDHVPPPPACKPDDTAPKLEKGDVGVAGGFDRYGFRVPLTIVSPYAKAGYVSHATYDHSSITRFIEAKFKLPALSGRDANADPFTDMFDWDDPPFVNPPHFDEPGIDQAEVQYCTSTFAK